MFAKRSPVVVHPPVRHPQEQVLELNGKWGVRLDPEHIGLDQKWYAYPQIYASVCPVPGCIQSESIGPSVGTYNGEYSCEVRMYKSGYLDHTWYSTTFTAQAAAADERLWLNFGGVSPTAYVWVNGTQVGENRNPFISFGFDVTDLIHDGENFVTVLVTEEDRWFALGYNCLGIWSGIYRGVELKRVRKAVLDDLRIVPDWRAGTAELTYSASGKLSGGELLLTVREYGSGKQVYSTSCPISIGEEHKIVLEVGEVCPWSPDDPFLYCLEAVLQDCSGVCDARTERFGFVEMTTRGRQFLINGKPYFLRGTGEFAENPISISPDTNLDNWRRKLKTLRDYGYNYVRCQSYKPGDEYIQAADEVGLLVQSELGTLGAIAANHYEHIYAWPQPNAENCTHLLEQWTLGVKMSMNHPSARMWCMSNELYANEHITEYPKVAWKCYRETKKLDPLSLVIWTDGGLNMDLPSDYVNDHTHGLYPLVPEDRSLLTDRPYIQHEFQWWTSYVDVRLKDRFNGGVFEFGIDRACKMALKNGIADLLIDFVKVSQQVQLLEMKGKLEEQRRTTPELAGINHFNATDIIGGAQGVLNAFYEKKTADADTWQMTNGDCVLLCDLGFEDRCLEYGKPFRCEIGVSDFAHPAFTCGTVSWKIVSDDRVLVSGVLNYTPVPGRYEKAGEIQVVLPEGTTPLPATLVVEMAEGDRCVRNEWEVYIFPDRNLADKGTAVYRSGMRDWLNSLQLPSFAEAGSDTEVVITDALTDEILDFVKKGGKALIAAGEGMIRAFHPQGILGPAKLGRYYFTKPASYPPFEEGQYGTLITPSPLLGDFPIREGDIHAGLQFFNMIRASAPIDAAPLDLGRDGFVLRMIHTWMMARPLAELVWYRCGEGSIAIISLDLDQKRVEARTLLSNLVNALKQEPTPQAEISEKTIQKMREAAELMK